MKLQKLTGLRPQTYEHPLDRSTLNALEKVPGLDSVVVKWNEFMMERWLRVQYTGSYLRATPDSCPELIRALRESCEILDLREEPAVYIQPGYVNAFTAGTSNPIMVLNAPLIDLLTEEQLRFVIGHELGHIKSGHVLYYQIAETLPELVELVGTATLGWGNLLSVPVQIALKRWQQMSELTADRAGLLACQSLDAAIGAMIRISGLPYKLAATYNPEDFLAQARAFEALNQDKLDWFFKLLSTLYATHPWTVLRASELLKWYDGGGFERVVSAPAGGGFCTGCGTTLPGGAKFCTACGRSISTPLPDAGGFAQGKAPTGGCFCTVCGKALPGGTKFCTACGSQI